MSRGPGRIERTIARIFETEPDNAFTIEDLCRRVYRGINRVEKKHRVAVLRAAERLRERRDTLSRFQWSTIVAYYNIESALSYSMARLKSDSMYGYPNDASAEELRARLDEGGDHHDYVVPGGIWWKHTQSAIAELEAARAGDTKRVEQIQAESAAYTEAALQNCAENLHRAARQAFHGSVTCNFCGKTEDQVRLMITGDSAAICNECVDACIEQRDTSLSCARPVEAP